MHPIERLTMGEIKSTLDLVMEKTRHIGSLLFLLPSTWNPQR